MHHRISLKCRPAPWLPSLLPHSIITESPPQNVHVPLWIHHLRQIRHARITPRPTAAECTLVRVTAIEAPRMSSPPGSHVFIHLNISSGRCPYGVPPNRFNSTVGGLNDRMPAELENRMDTVVHTNQITAAIRANALIVQRSITVVQSTTLQKNRKHIELSQ